MHTIQTKELYSLIHIHLWSVGAIRIFFFQYLLVFALSTFVSLDD